MTCKTPIPPVFDQFRLKVVGGVDAGLLQVTQQGPIAVGDRDFLLLCAQHKLNPNDVMSQLVRVHVAAEQRIASSDWPNGLVG